MRCQRVCKLQFKVTVEGAFLALTYVICLSSQLNVVYFQMAEGIAHVMQSLLLWEPLKTSSLLTFLLLCKVLLVLMVFPILCTIHASTKNNLPPIKGGKSAAFFFLKDTKYTVNLP